MATAEILSASVANGTISSWAFAGNLPSPAYVHATIAVDSRLYLVASAEGRTPTCAARSSVCAVVDGDTIYVLGGRFSDTDMHASVVAGRVTATGAVLWTPLPPMPEGRAAFGCAVR